MLMKKSLHFFSVDKNPGCRLSEQVVNGRHDMRLDCIVGRLGDGQVKVCILFFPGPAFLKSRLHLLIDATYELPIAYKVTKASCNEGKVMKNMLSILEKAQEAIITNINYALFDRGYDDEVLIKKLWDTYKIKPIIDIRNLWKDSL